MHPPHYKKGIDSNSTVYCGHYYTYYTNDPRQAPKCMGWHYNTNILKALQKSCNIFFFDVGRRLGIEKLDAYGTLFGLGQKTGLEVSESPGVLTNPEDYERRSGDTWTDGMTLSAAIGQLDNSFTPLQLASYCSSIANGGHRLQLHLVDKITDYTRENTIEKKGANVLNEVGVDDKNLEIVRRVCVWWPKAVVPLRILPTTASKSGQKPAPAEVNGHSDNVTFIGFAPYDKPEIAIAVVLETVPTAPIPKILLAICLMPISTGLMWMRRGDRAPLRCGYPGGRELRDKGASFRPST